MELQYFFAPCKLVQPIDILGHYSPHLNQAACMPQTECDAMAGKGREQYGKYPW